MDAALRRLGAAMRLLPWWTPWVWMYVAAALGVVDGSSESLAPAVADTTLLALLPLALRARGLRLGRPRTGSLRARVVSGVPRLRRPLAVAYGALAVAVLARYDRPWLQALAGGLAAASVMVWARPYPWVTPRPSPGGTPPATRRPLDATR